MVEGMESILKACGSATTYVIALVGLSCVVYFGLAGVKLQKWSARNDSLQVCLALSSTSAYCNATIAFGIEPPPIKKRNLFKVLATSARHGSDLRVGIEAIPLIVAVAALTTVAMYASRRDILSSQNETAPTHDLSCQDRLRVE